MRIAVLVVLSCCSTGLSAAGLSDIYRLARDNDALFAAAREAYRANIEKFEQAKALFRPTVTATASFRSNSDVNALYESESRYGSRSNNISIVQPLFSLPNVHAYAQGELQAQSAQLQLRQAEQDLILRASKAYFDILQAQDSLSSVLSQKEAYAKQLAQTRKSLQVGTMAITDLNEAQTKYDLTVAQEIALRNEVEIKRRALQRIVRQVPPAMSRFDESARIDVGAKDELATLADRASEGSVAVAIAQVNREIADREATKQEVGFMPTVELTATSRRDYNLLPAGSIQPMNTRQASIGFEFSWPLFQGGALSSKQRESAANLTKAGFELDDARRQSAFDAQQAYLSVISGSAQITALEQGLSSAEAQVKSTRRGFEIGVRTQLDVLNAEQQLAAARRDLSAARYQTLYAWIQLRAHAGVLSAQDLQTLDAWFRP